MLEKLTKDRVLDRKMQRQILGGDCGSQCFDDCGSDSQIRVSQNGDSEGKKIADPPVIVKLR